MGQHHRPLLGGCAVLLCLLLQAGRALGEDSPCVPGFKGEKYTFTVGSRELDAGTVLGKVTFDGCPGLNRVLYFIEDENFAVQSDGILLVIRHTLLRNWERSFLVNAYNESGKIFSTMVTLRLEGQHHRRLHHKKNHTSAKHTESQVLFFPRVQPVLRRQKRKWDIPGIKITENQTPPFPKKVEQIRFFKDKETTIYYKITGPGFDMPPVGIFSLERSTGVIQVHGPLDREAIDEYKITCYAETYNGIRIDEPFNLIILVTDQNDNGPVFTQAVFKGKVAEGSQPGTSVMQVNATDADDSTDTCNGCVYYRILDQDPKSPNDKMFEIDMGTGVIRVNARGLDREAFPRYDLTVQAYGSEDNRVATSTAVIFVTDTNDNTPIFEPAVYTTVVPENKVGFVCQTLTVTDRDSPNTQAWNAEYKIIKGNDGGNFNVTTDSITNKGILTTAKGLDFETENQYILLIIALNEVPVTGSPTPSTATVTVSVGDENEAPIFVTPTKEAEVREDLLQEVRITTYTAQDPDKMQAQKITYSIDEDPARWLSINPDSGAIFGNGNLDREAKAYLTNDVYKATILATDNGIPSLTGTGTLLIHLLDVNDNTPEPVPQNFTICIQNPEPQSLKIVDPDIEPNTFPYTVELSPEFRENWTAEVAEESLVIKPPKTLELKSYKIPVTLGDSANNRKLTTIEAVACNCYHDTLECVHPQKTADVPAILGTLLSILALLILLLVLMLFLRKKKVVGKELLLPPEDENRDNVHSYDEEGGGEDDQNYDLSQLHRGLDARPRVMRNDVVPTLIANPKYRPRPANPDEISDFIDENLKAADDDPTAPPYDCLLVFDFEGGGSEAASLSSINSSNSDADQDYNGMKEWGPRFQKLADMYGGDED